jgi:hypothetical protein
VGPAATTKNVRNIKISVTYPNVEVRDANIKANKLLGCGRRLTSTDYTSLKAETGVRFPRERQQNQGFTRGSVRALVGFFKFSSPQFVEKSHASAPFNGQRLRFSC